jgi:hypothetical protein
MGLERESADAWLNEKKERRRKPALLLWQFVQPLNSDG